MPPWMSAFRAKAAIRVLSHQRPQCVDQQPSYEAGVALEYAFVFQLVIGVVAMGYTGAVFSALFGPMDFSMSINRNAAGDRYPSFRYSKTTF